MMNERAVEYAFALREMAGVCPTLVIDVGSGKTVFPAVLARCLNDDQRVHAIDIDTTLSCGQNKFFPVTKHDITSGPYRGSYDLVTCISVIEHIEDHVQAARNMMRMLAPNGVLVITCPFRMHEPYIPRVRSQGLCHSFSRADIDRWMSEGITLETTETWDTWTGTFWGDGARKKPIQVNPAARHQLGCFSFRRTNV